MPNDLTEKEYEVLEYLGHAWNSFYSLPIEHGDDTDEFRHHLHILQRQIMCRPVRRSMKE